VRFPDGVRRRLYKTGNLARWLPSGDIDFAGRIDHQIKLGSYRIEPQEIEHHLAMHPQVREALVCCDEIDGRKCLTAYVACGDAVLNAEEMIRSVSSRLPAYMIPQRYVFIDSFPKTINGKIDRRALPDASIAITSSKTSDAPPNTETEKCLAAIFADVLQLKSIGIYDDFFELGGSSLLVTRVIAEVRKHFDMPIPVRDFFANPTVAMIAALLDCRAANAGTQSRPPANPVSNVPAIKLPTPVPLFFTSPLQGNGGSQQVRLFGVHYPPCAPRTGHAILICSPEGNEYVRAHRNLQQLALLLSRIGADVLRFDYSGHGNSGGDCATVGPDQWKSDICEGLARLRTLANPSRVTIVAMRLGATMVANTKLVEVDDLILVDPVRCGRSYLKMIEEFDKKELTSLNRYDRVRRPSVEQLHGQRFSREKFDAIANLQLPSTDFSGAKKTLVLTTSRYEDAEGLLLTPPNWSLQPCRDVVGWHRQEYTHAAFASADLYRNILQRVQS